MTSLQNLSDWVVAAVMLGNKKGLAVLLKQSRPVLVEVHCFAHRLELGFKDAVKKSNLYEKTVATLLMGLHYFYRNSPLNRSILTRSFSALGSKVYLPTRVGGTRWIGHLLRALTNFQNGYPATLQHLQQVCASSFELIFQIYRFHLSKYTHFLRYAHYNM